MRGVYQGHHPDQYPTVCYTRSACVELPAYSECWQCWLIFPVSTVSGRSGTQGDPILISDSVSSLRALGGNCLKRGADKYNEGVLLPNKFLEVATVI